MSTPTPRKKRTISPEHQEKLRKAHVRGKSHPFFGKPAHNSGKPISEEQREKLRAKSPGRTCLIWHIRRGYTDPSCSNCAQRVSNGESEGFSTEDEIDRAKQVWKAARSISK